MTPQQKDAMQMALDALVSSTGELHLRLSSPTDMQLVKNHKAIQALRTALAQPDVPENCFGETKQVAMKFQIYKQTPPRGRELEPINSALLPWIYDQDPSSGTTASMWVTPVATLPLQRKPLTREEIEQYFYGRIDFVRAIETAHGIGEVK